MTILEEGDLRLELPSEAAGKNFDDDQHGLSRCMKAVDWVVDFKDHIWFIEVKDPDDPNAARHNNKEQFLQDFKAGIITPKLVTKFRDSFLYEWACNRVDKSVSYYVIIASSSLDPAQLLSRTDHLKRELPAENPDVWTRPIAKNCIVFNIETWNKHFPRCRLSRDTDTS